MDFFRRISSTDQHFLYFTRKELAEMLEAIDEYEHLDWDSRSNKYKELGLAYCTFSKRYTINICHTGKTCWKFGKFVPKKEVTK